MVQVAHAFARTLDAVSNVCAAAAIPYSPWSLLHSVFAPCTITAGTPPGFEGEYDNIGSSRLRTLAAGYRALVSFPYQRKLLGVRSAPDPAPANYKIPSERWFFINGICTDHALAQVNAAALEAFSGRDVHLLYNNTDGFIFDLAECAFGKTFDRVTESVAPNLLPLVQAMVDPTVSRVVLVAHSQGTIVAAVMLKLIQEVLLPGSSNVPLAGIHRPSSERLLAQALASGRVSPWLVPDRSARADFVAARTLLQTSCTLSDVAKLELYCFANCATSMAPFVHVSQPNTRSVPWIESYGNQFDIVARLGVLAAPHGKGSSRIDGDRYFIPQAWGHLLNEHYLAPMYPAMSTPAGRPGAWRPFPTNLRGTPRLWGFANGGTPGPPP
jgi:hypothetical protein